MSAGQQYGHGPAFDKAAYYSTDDTPDTLVHECPEDALGEHVDQGGDLPVTVYAWVRRKKPRTFGSAAIEGMLDSFEEAWSEEYGDPAGDHKPWSADVRAEVCDRVQCVLDRFLALAFVWQCDVVAAAEFTDADARALGLIEADP